MLHRYTLFTTLLNRNSEEYLFVGGDFNCTEQDLVRNHTELYMMSHVRLN